MFFAHEIIGEFPDGHSHGTPEIIYRRFPGLAGKLDEYDFEDLLIFKGQLHNRLTAGELESMVVKVFQHGTWHGAAGVNWVCFGVRHDAGCPRCNAPVVDGSSPDAG